MQLLSSAYFIISGQLKLFNLKRRFTNLDVIFLVFRFNYFSLLKAGAVNKKFLLKLQFKISINVNVNDILIKQQYKGWQSQNIENQTPQNKNTQQKMCQCKCWVNLKAGRGWDNTRWNFTAHFPPHHFPDLTTIHTSENLLSENTHRKLVAMASPAWDIG